MNRLSVRSDDSETSDHDPVMESVDRSSPVPLYAQLKRILLGQLQRRRFEPGERIPSENALEDMYGLSRITVRQALAELVNEGFLDRQQGRGTFVTRPKFTHDPTRRLALTDTMIEQGVAPGWRVLGIERIPAPDEVAERLELAAGASVHRLERLRLADSEVIGHHLAYVPDAFARYVDEYAHAEGGSLHYLRNLPALASSKAHRTLEALAGDEGVARRLAAEPGAPILRIERVVVAVDGTPLEFMRASYRGDRFKYRISL